LIASAIAKLARNGSIRARWFTGGSQLQEFYWDETNGQRVMATNLGPALANNSEWAYLGSGTYAPLCLSWLVTAPQHRHAVLHQAEPEDPRLVEDQLGPTEHLLTRRHGSFRPRCPRPPSEAGRLAGT